MLSLVPSSTTLTLPAFGEESHDNSSQQNSENTTNTDNHASNRNGTNDESGHENGSNTGATTHENSTESNDDRHANTNSTGAEEHNNATSNNSDDNQTNEHWNNTLAGRHHLKKGFHNGEYFKQMLKYRMELFSHGKHSRLNSTSIALTMVANSTFTLTANGKAMGFTHDGSGTDSRNSTLVLNFSVVKSSERIISINMTGGTFTIGNETLDIGKGHAYLLTNHPRLFVFGYGPPEKAASTANHEDEHGHHLRPLVRLYVVPANIDELKAQLAGGTSDLSMPVKVIGMENTLHGHWFVMMNGEVSLT
ncbi:MAG: hypothetical protein ABI361_07530 [Nitrososphaera sp.]